MRKCHFKVNFLCCVTLKYCPCHLTKVFQIILAYDFSSRSIAHGTLEFFGLQKDEDEQDRTQRKWNERRVRLISRMGKIRSDHQIHRTDSTLDRADGVSKHRLATCVSQVMDGRGSLGNIYGVQPGKLKRESAASILWKTASKKMSSRVGILKF